MLTNKSKLFIGLIILFLAVGLFWILRFNHLTNPASLASIEYRSATITKDQTVLLASKSGVLKGVVEEKNILAEDIKLISASPYISDLIFAAGKRGFFRSNDGGRTWKKSFISGMLPVYSLAYESRPSDKIIAVSLTGFWESVDQGISWQPAGEEPIQSRAGLPAYKVLNIFFDPINPDTLYVSMETNRIYKSEDRGLSWKELGRELDMNYPGFLHASVGFVIDSLDPKQLYMSVTYEGGHIDVPGATESFPNISVIYHSNDGGKSWQKIKEMEQTKDTHILDLQLIPNINLILIVTETEVIIEQVR